MGRWIRLVPLETLHFPASSLVLGSSVKKGERDLWFPKQLQWTLQLLRSLLTGQLLHLLDYNPPLWASLSSWRVSGGDRTGRLKVWRSGCPSTSRPVTHTGLPKPSRSWMESQPSLQTPCLSALSNPETQLWVGVFKGLSTTGNLLPLAKTRAVKLLKQVTSLITSFVMN